MLPVPMWLGVSLNRNAFESVDSRYNQIHFSYRPVVKAIELLAGAGLIRVAKGFFDRERGRGRVTRIRCTAELHRLLSGISPASVSTDPAFELVRLKDFDGKLLEYSNAQYPETIEMRSFLVDINQKLGKCLVGLSDQTPPEARAYLRSACPNLNTHRTMLYRVFSGDINLGGRFYGPWWQSLPSHDVSDQDGKQVKWNVRQHLTIDGKPTVELDYSAAHGVLLYHDADKLDELTGDPYTVPGHEPERSKFKLIFQLLLNTTSLKGAKAACRSHDGLGPECVHLVDRLYAHHEPIQDRLLMDGGTMLQRADGVVRSYVRAAYSLALRAELAPNAPAGMLGFQLISNPIDPISPEGGGAGKRDRTLAAVELRAYLGALWPVEDIASRALLLALLSGGQRPKQLLRVRVADVDLRAGTLLLFDPKGRRTHPRPHLVPLGPRGLGVVDELVKRAKELQSEHLFSATGKNQLRIEPLMKRVAEIREALTTDNQLPGGNFQLKDVRRTVETMLAGLGISKDVRAQLLSHGLSGVQSQRYDMYDYLAEKRAAVIALEQRLEQIERGDL